MEIYPSFLYTFYSADVSRDGRAPQRPCLQNPIDEFVRFFKAYPVFPVESSSEDSFSPWDFSTFAALLVDSRCVHPKIHWIDSVLASRPAFLLSSPNADWKSCSCRNDNKDNAKAGNMLLDLFATKFFSPCFPVSIL